jgi:hypothetical protein
MGALNKRMIYHYRIVFSRSNVAAFQRRLAKGVLVLKFCIRVCSEFRETTATYAVAAHRSTWGVIFFMPLHILNPTWSKPSHPTQDFPSSSKIYTCTNTLQRNLPHATGMLVWRGKECIKTGTMEWSLKNAIALASWTSIKPVKCIRELIYRHLICIIYRSQIAAVIQYFFVIRRFCEDFVFAQSVDDGTQYILRSECIFERNYYDTKTT